jgi:hypothetical protein
MTPAENKPDSTTEDILARFLEIAINLADSSAVRWLDSW